MPLSSIINTLENATCTEIENKNSAYRSLLSYLKSDFSKKKELQKYATNIFDAVQQDILLDSVTVVLALEVLQLCLKEIQFESFDFPSLLQCLLQRAPNLITPEVIVLLLRCLNQQTFLSDQIITEMLEILDLTDEKSLTTAQYALLVEETVQLLFNYEKKVGDVFRITSPAWAFYTIPALGSPSTELRQKAFQLLDKYFVNVLNITLISKRIIKCLNIGMAVSLKKLMLKDPIYVIDVWILLIKLVGKEIHKGSTINAMLEIIEIGFKSSAEIRSKAFVAWRHLIDNFALDEKVIGDQKRINLLMLVLKIDNAKVENVAKEKLFTWWHFVKCLGTKLSANIEQIVYPLVQFCLGCCSSAKLGLSSSGSKLSSPKTSNPVSVFPSVQQLGFEVLAHIIGKLDPNAKLNDFQWTLEPLNCYEATSLNFVRHSPFIFTSLQELFDAVGCDSNQSLLLYIWLNLGSQVKAVLESRKCREVFSNFMSLLHFIVHREKVETDTALKMVIKSCEFPQKVLAATAYNIICTGATLKACPAQLLIEILLTPVILSAFKCKTDFISIFLKLVNGGISNAQGALFFVQNVSEMLSSHASLLQEKEMLFQIWTEMAQLLHSHLLMTNEVNQGDALDHNFNCLLAVLSLPFKHRLTRCQNTGENKTLFKVWKELYQTFARLSALVPTAEANICMEQLSARLITLPPAVETLPELEFWVMACYQMIESADFTPFTHHQQLSSGVTIGAYNMKRRQRTLGCFNSIIHLVAELLTKANQPKILKKIQDDVLSNILSLMVDICTTLFCHIDGSFFIQKCFELLAQPLAEIFKLSASDRLKSVQSSLLIKVEKLWHEINVCLLGRYKGVLDTEFLATMAPLFEMNFMHTSNIIQNETVSCWNSTFGRLSNLAYPDNLSYVLKKVKEKKSVKLLGPGWIPFDVNAVIAETPFSDVIMDDIPVPNIPSPKHQKGSLLKDVSPHRLPSPSPKSSPVRVINPKSHNLLSSAKKNIALDFMPEDDFVVINSPSTRQRRILTEHQKEVLKEKRVIPAMYNNLDASQDVSLGAHFILDTQHESDSVADCHFGRSVSNTIIMHKESCSSMNDPEPFTVKSNSQRVLVSSKEKALEDTNRFTNDFSSAVLAAKTKNSSEIVNEKVSEEKKKSLAGSINEQNQNFTPLDKEPNLLQESGFSLEILNCEVKNLTNNDLSMSQDTGMAALSSPKSKNKLRHIQSQDEKTDQLQKIKPPRRVPLKKISELNFEPEKTVAKLGISLAGKFSNAADDKVSTTVPADAADTPSEDKKSTQTKKQSSKFSGGPHSARKLFLDPKHVPSDESVIDQEKIELDTQTANITSSQGFNSEERLNNSNEKQISISPVSEGLLESENLFSSNQHSQNEYSLEQMPTLLSPSKSLSNFAVSVDPSIEESGTSTCSSNVKTVSSSESSFNPSQSTLKEDCPKEERKRKSKVPKKYSPVIRPEKRHRKCKVGPENKKKSIKSKSEKVDNLIDEQFSLNLPEISTNSTSDEQKTNVINKFATIESKQAKIGEVTPNLKSPNNDNPIQTRHSSVKRKGRLSKRLARHSTSDSHNGLNADELDNLNSVESPNKSVTRKRKLLTDISPCRTKRKYSKKSISPKFQQMLKLKSKATRRLSSSTETSPVKKRKLSSDLLDSSDDNLPLILTKNLKASELKNKKCNIVHALEKPLVDKVTTMNVSDKSQLIDDALNSALSQISASVRHNSLVNTETTPLASAPSQEFSETSENSLQNKNVNIIPSDHLSAHSESISSEGKINEHNSENCDLIEPSVPDSKLSEEMNRSVIVSHDKLMQDKACISDQSKTEDLSLCKNVNLCGKANEQENGNIKENEMEAKLQINISDNNICSRLVGDVDSAIINSDSRCDGESVDSAIDNSNLRPDDSAIINVDSRPDGESVDSVIINRDSRPDGESVDFVIINCNSRPDGKSVDSAIINRDSRPGGKSVDSVIINCNSRPDGKSVDSAINDSDSRCDREIDSAGARDLPTDIYRSLDVQDCVFVNSDCSVMNLKTDSETEDSLGKMEMSFHDWSPSKSPNFSILKKTVSETPPSAQSRRVSFAEPVVSGESPVREKYHFERMANSTPREGSKARTSLFSRQLKHSHRHVRKFETSPKKLNWEKNFDIIKKSHCPDASLVSQTTYKATQESQLNSAGPVFPELVECTKPLDDILPQLTSSFWYRGLCQLMKGRNLNTIGDLSNLTEVQINQLPFRTPKVQTVKTTLIAYMAQHGLNKTKLSHLDDNEKDSTLTTNNETIVQSVSADSHVCTTSKLDFDCQQPSDTKKSTLITDFQKFSAEIQESGLKNLSTPELFEIQATTLEILGNINKELKDRFLN